MKKWLMFVSPLLALALLLGACVSAPGAPPASGPGSPGAAASYIVPPMSSQQTGLWVNGEGKVTFAPDIAMLTLGIESQEKTVALAQSKARDAMTRVLAALKDKNVADKDIRTQTFSIHPVTQFIQAQQFPVPQPGREVIIGYRVSNTVVVKIRKIADAGQIIDAVSESGGDLTRINGISFTIDDPTPLRNQAREKAVKDGSAKARQIAEAAGIGLGRPIYINESGGFVPKAFDARSFGAAMAAEAAPTPISPGEMELSVSVQMVFEMK